MSDNKRIDAPTGTSTVGHEWDGIEELDTPMPRWWVFTFWATIIWAIGYVIVYPAIPMIDGATKGLWNWSSRDDLSRDIAADARRRASVTSALTTTPVELLAQNPRLLQAAVEGGRAAFKVHCVQCHGSGAAGSKGYPNLNDDDWLWGGDINAIHYSIVHGIRNPDHPETRTSQMPAFGGVLSAGEITSVVAFVRTISGQAKANAQSAKGAALFANNCAACHGPDGKGGREFGAPNLTDGIWLYGGDSETIRATITRSRAGVMPRWANRLDGVTIKMLASYVYSLGGGETAPAPKAGATEKAAEKMSAPEVAANVQP